MTTIWVRVLPKFDNVPHDDVHDAKWRWVVPHVASREVSEAILRVCADETKAAGPDAVLGPYEIREETKHWLDIGGMCHRDRKLYELTVDGLKLTVPATDVGIYYDIVQACVADRSKAGTRFEHYGVEMYRFPVFPVSLFLTRTQMRVLHSELGKILDEASENAKAETAAIAQLVKTAPGLARQVWGTSATEPKGGVK